MIWIYYYRNSCLVKETESHVVIGFFLLLFLFFNSGCFRGSSTTSGGCRGSGTTSRWNRSQFGVTFSNQFFKVFTSQFFDNDSNLFTVALDTDDIQDFFDGGLSGLSASKGD